MGIGKIWPLIRHIKKLASLREINVWDRVRARASPRKNQIRKILTQRRSLPIAKNKTLISYILMTIPNIQ